MRKAGNYQLYSKQLLKVCNKKQFLRFYDDHKSMVKQGKKKNVFEKSSSKLKNRFTKKINQNIKLT